MTKPSLKRLLNSQLSAPDITRGIERECLRVTHQHQLAQTMHPESFGSKITNPFITTDFAEAQLELITPPTNNLDQQLELLEQLHLFIFKHLNQQNEHIWPASMPCPAAFINSSNYPANFKGIISHRYRLGLGHRYGKQMQLICGLHYNLSFSDRVIAAVQGCDSATLQRDNKDEFYVRMADNFFKYCDILLFLTGKTPTFIEQSLKSDFDNCCRKENGDLGMPNSLSLRNSNIGYVSAKQEQLLQPIPQLENYVDLVSSGMNTVEPEFTDIPNDQQLNDRITQLPNELYLPFRLKSTKPDILPNALRKHGVEYVEIRLLDLDINSPIGIDRTELLLIEVFCLWCSCQEATQQSILAGYQKYSDCACSGADPTFKLPYSDSVLSQFCQQLSEIAAVLDQNSVKPEYQTALQAKLADLIPESNATAALQMTQQPLLSKATEAMQQHREYFESLPENAALQATFKLAAEQSKPSEDQLNRLNEAQFQEQFAKFCDLSAI